MKPAAFRAGLDPDWCPGCGNYGIVAALTRAFAELGLTPDRVALVSGIGCSAKTVHYLNAYGLHTLHGRGLPVAQGLKLARPELTVIAIAGDGDGMGIGAGHFVGAGRRNVDLTYLLFNNEVYGMTKGQAAPTLELGAKPKGLARPNVQARVNPLTLAYAAGFTFIARGFAFDTKGLAGLIAEAIRHPGLALVEILQPCPTYNDLHPREWFAERIRPLAEEGYDPERAGPGAFLEKAEAFGDRIPVGVFWRRRLPTFEERIGLVAGRDKPPAERARALLGAARL
ncbi:MAG TPA: 2-oxoacid:ferredoxin oxidoreductase subunit beta [Oceanithermus sp.]|nr:2-oxoacid:ferredoxin oxidoreductase subunit beta [Oceanithermus sp.]